MASFQKAVKTAARLRLALTGPAGSGKTWTALALATALAQGQPVALIDTERGSASKYADTFAFDVLELTTFHPSTYIEAIQEAARAGYAVVVIDSLSHAWNGKGGILEIVQRKGNSFQAWGEVKPIENALIEAIIGAPLHIIATMRSKTEYVVEQNEKGKSTPRKVGLAPVQRDGMEYEFDVFGELDQENTLTIQKTRCPALTGAVILKPGQALADTLATWLTSASVSPASNAWRAPVPMPTPAARPVTIHEPVVEVTTPSGHRAGRGAPKIAERWPALQLRMRALGIINMAMANEVAQHIVDQDWLPAAQADHDTDYELMVAYVVDQEARAAAAKARFERGEAVGRAAGAPVPAGHEQPVDDLVPPLESLSSGTRAN